MCFSQMVMAVVMLSKGAPPVVVDFQVFHQIMREITKEEAPELRNELLRFKKEVFDPLEESIEKRAQEIKDAANRRRQAKSRALKQRQQQQEDETSSSGQGSQEIKRPAVTPIPPVPRAHSPGQSHDNVSQIPSQLGRTPDFPLPSFSPGQSNGDDLLGSFDAGGWWNVASPYPSI
uniref:Uncharacterized protein n=2 Tax=Lotharella globosa TaxID=91324 RepID=A0A6V3LPY1_9EUKA|mmetsp:Transcript_6096/g.12083  ORF Transcript_6096/g.12083 Transcript_6096/m.12083 type:complete len:176 (+) Transcript_6096:301-828(+)